jgi:hypothetical protein
MQDSLHNNNGTFKTPKTLSAKGRCIGSSSPPNHVVVASDHYDRGNNTVLVMDGKDFFLFLFYQACKYED